MNLSFPDHASFLKADGLRMVILSTPLVPEDIKRTVWNWLQHLCVRNGKADAYRLGGEFNTLLKAARTDRGRAWLEAIGQWMLESDLSKILAGELTNGKA